MVKKETYLTCPDANIFEGMTSISAIIQNLENEFGNPRKIVRVLFDKEKTKSKSRELAFLRKKAAIFDFSVELVDRHLIDEKTTGNTHGGIIAECLPKEIGALSEYGTQIETNGIYIMLDGVEDPYNFGYSLRSVYAAGISGVVLPPRNWMDVAGIVSKSSAGASELINMYVAEPQEAISFFRQRGYKIICSGIRNSVSMYDADMKAPVFLIIGGEKRGISAAIEQQADVIARIEYGREFRGSLSTASAATIMAYEAYRQNRKK